MSWAIHRDTLTHRKCPTHRLRHRWHSTCPACATDSAHRRVDRFRTADQLAAVADACEALR